ncbi:hypothetical protein [uncultured Gemmiger sp.]|uniref:hypothetical protein n=1 Tax=uncultured Gemmiger sp. TaxID=1623490 RepID=UPI0025FEA334|nr:hypothetical protein [uncultured Gemmiger sp.]
MTFLALAIPRHPKFWSRRAHTKKQRAGPCSDALFLTKKERERGVEMKKIEAFVPNFRKSLFFLLGVPVRFAFGNMFRIPPNCDKKVTDTSTFYERSYNEL